MKGFQYSMEQILDYRKGIENKEQQEFMEKREEYEKQKNILNDYEKRLDKAVSSQTAIRAKLTVGELKSRYQYIHHLQKKTEIQKRLVLEAKRAMEAKKQKLLSAQKDRKIMEKHKEKAFRAFNYEMNKAEQKIIDELALYSYMRK